MSTIREQVLKAIDEAPTKKMLADLLGCSRPTLDRKIQDDDWTWNDKQILIKHGIIKREKLGSDPGWTDSDEADSSDDFRSPDDEREERSGQIQHEPNLPGTQDAAEYSVQGFT